MNAKTEKIYRYIALVFAIVVLWVALEMARDIAWELQLDSTTSTWPQVTGELTGCSQKTFSGGKYPSRTIIYLYVNGQSQKDRYQYRTRKDFEEDVRELCRVGGEVELKYFFAEGNQTAHWIGSLTSQKQGVIFTEQDTLSNLQSTGNLISGVLVVMSFLIGAVWAFLIFLGKARISK